MNLVFLQYNNYYNRITKKYDRFEDYISNHRYDIKENVNFNPNDNINTTLTVNWSNTWTPDYVLISTPGTEEFTRWFVLDTIRLRGQQYQMVLKHDLVADNLTNILEADAFIEKAILSSDDPLIFNKEAMTVNQIKKAEHLLKDASGCAWICGYFGDNFNIDNNIMMRGSFLLEPNYDYVIPTSRSTWKYKNGANQLINIKVLSSLNKINYSSNYRSVSSGDARTYLFNFTDTQPGIYNQSKFTDYNSATTYVQSIVGSTLENNAVSASYMNGPTNISGESYPHPIDVCDAIFAAKDAIISQLQSSISFETNSVFNEDFMKYNNKVVKFLDSNGNAEYCRVTITKGSTNKQWTRAVSANRNALYYTLFNQLKTVVPSLQDQPISAVGLNPINNFYINVESTAYSISFSTIETGEYYVDIYQGRNKLEDAPYRMFCMPYNLDKTIKIKNTGSSVPTIYQDSNISLKLATALATAYHGANQIYDIQILPYCPIQEIIGDDNELDVKNGLYNHDIIYYKKNNTKTPVGYVFYPNRSIFTVDIPFNEYNLTNVKMNNETDTFRLVSPNYNGQFEFNLAKNGGLSSFNVDCSYIPYQPYIHVNPNFGNLYGGDFNDARGLICGGDFSITMMTDAWSTYQIQNKNYENIFNREIQNLEVQHDVTRTRENINAATGILQGGVSGAMAGSKGGVWGAVAGAVVGTATSAGGAALDYSLNETLRQESLDYKRDMFGYQLGNVKALPQSISKTTAFTYNNKFFPILEYYTCTEQEKKAMAYKIAYNSMTVMCIGKLRDYISNTWSYGDIESKGYIKCSLIRLENLQDDYHVLNEISNELYKGIYLQGVN